MMKRGNGKARAALFSVILTAVLAAALTTGCGEKEQNRVIELPPLEIEIMDVEKLRINSIQEYVGAGREEERLQLAWGEGAELLYRMKVEDSRYLFQTIDTKSNTVLGSICVDERAADMSNIFIAPGGRYVSYEIQNGGGGMELRAFFPETGIRQILHTWEDSQETFSYIWSDDGNKLISWQNGNTKNPYADWCITEYDLESVQKDTQDGSAFIGWRSQFLMEGQGYSWRIVLPNADGSEIYVREQFRTFNASVTDDEAKQEDHGRNAFNWLLLTKTSVRTELSEYSQESVYPVKYTPTGLFVQEEDGALSLVDHIRGEHPQKRVLIPGSYGQFAPSFCICEKGDHVFFAEWLDYSRYQISGVRIVDGVPEGDPVVLYQDNYDSLVRMTVWQDQAVVFWGTEPTGENQYQYKITMLEY